MTLQTNRRSFVAAIPAIAAASAVAVPTLAAGNPDAEIIAHFARWQAAFDAFDAMDPDCDPEEEKPYWQVIDEAEEAIRVSVAKTPRGAAIKLWIAMAHAQTSAVPHIASRRCDLTKLIEADEKMDWTDRLVFSALRDLTTMEG